MDSFISKMNNRIIKEPYGKCFVVSDFTDIMDYETAKKNIARLEKKGILRRVVRGVYDKPKYSKLLVAPIGTALHICYYSINILKSQCASG